ncbi:MAG: hypothetical protein AAFY11_03255 [Cyanobacteria bacterium J06641_5]
MNFLINWRFELFLAAKMPPRGIEKRGAIAHPGSVAERPAIDGRSCNSRAI